MILSASNSSSQLPYENSAYGIYTSHTSRPYFQQEMGFTEQEYFQWCDQHMENLGAHWTRISILLMWDIIEPEIGKGYYWDRGPNPDKLLSAVYNPPNKINILAVLHPIIAFGDRRNPLDFPDAFKKWVRACVERYDGDGINDVNEYVKVKYWQLGNEIQDYDIKIGEPGSVYGKCLELFEEALHQADPEAKIALIAQPGGNIMDPFLKNVVDTCIVRNIPFDVVDLHHFGTASEWEIPALKETREFLDSKGLQRVEIWSFENGTYVGSPQPANRFPPQTEEYQARSLIKRFVYNRNNGLDKIVWNNLVDWYMFNNNPHFIFNSLGLVGDGALNGETPDKLNKERLSYYAYKLLTENTDNHIAEPTG